MASSASTAVSEPIAIYKLAHRYLLYDINVVTYLRKEHNISGVLIGSLPQASQQNVFLGLPLELMPEEARLLVEKKVAFIVDDAPEHKRNFMGNGLSSEERQAFQAALRKQGQGAAREATKKSDDRKKAALKKLETDNWNDIPDDMFGPTTNRRKKTSKAKERPVPSSAEGAEDDVLFASPANSFPAPSLKSRTPSNSSLAVPESYGITPTTSQPPLHSNTGTTDALPLVPKSYPLYKYMHKNGYFLSPGLRFGCQYTAYPGDPLRFHSHFLCNGMDWDQEFDLLDLVGGGRLGTGVKKGFLIGGEQQKEVGAEGEGVRAFCVEWGGM